MTYIGFTVNPPQRLFPGEHMTFLHSGDMGRGRLPMPELTLMNLRNTLRLMMPFHATVSHFCRVTVDGVDQMAWKMDIPHWLHGLHYEFREYHTQEWGDWKPHITPLGSMNIGARLPGSTVLFTDIEFKP